MDTGEAFHCESQVKDSQVSHQVPLPLRVRSQRVSLLRVRSTSQASVTRRAPALRLKIRAVIGLCRGRGQREGFQFLEPPTDQFLQIPEPRPTKAL